jgi:hypothetical protein
MDWMKILTNLYHMALPLISAYLVAHPQEYGWLIPVLQFYGQTLPPPDFQPAMKLQEVPRVP